MKNVFSYTKYLVFGLLMLFFSANAEQADSSNFSFVRMSGHLPNKALEKASFLNNVEPSKEVPITFTLPLRNEDELRVLINRLYNPSDELYGKFLSCEEFVERFGPTEEDYQKVIAYAEEIGLAVGELHPNRLLVDAVGDAQSLEAAFNLSLHHYELPSGRQFYAPSDEPQVPLSIASIIDGVIGLDNQGQYRPYHRLREDDSFQNEFEAFAAAPSKGLSPQDIAKAYNLTTVPADGSGQVIGLFQLGNYNVSDINEYTKTFGLPDAKLKDVIVGGGASGGADSEVTLDIELALSLAPQSQIYVYKGPNTSRGALNIYNRIATDNIAKQVSTSWGMGEDSMDGKSLRAENAIFMQMAAHGQTMYAAAGDTGAYNEDAAQNPSSRYLDVDDPAAQPYVVGVGGTTLKVDPTTGDYQNESVWNNGLKSGAGGGGVSKFWPIPDWQKNTPGLSSQRARNVPDVALHADSKNGYAIFYKGRWVVYGGTSCAAPLWASFTSLVNQKRVADSKKELGYGNPAFYAIGTSAAYTADFHDVIQGDNLYYPAHAGYDNATGWGSFNGANLFIELTNLQ